MAFWVSTFYLFIILFFWIKKNAIYLLEKKKSDAIYLSLPPTRHDLTQGQKPEDRLKWG